ncbi:MAG: hypothetical protein ACHQ2Z_14620, partial [Elusimicrobiota bacterium]
MMVYWRIAADEIAAAYRATAGKIAGRWRDHVRDLRSGIGADGVDGRVRAGRRAASRHGDSYGYAPTSYRQLE